MTPAHLQARSSRTPPEFLSRNWLVRLLVLVVILAGSPSAPLAAEPRPNILLLTIDTLRADRLGCLGSGRPTSPAIDGLARRGVLFENALANGGWTTPGLLSVLTGLYPRTHRVIARDSVPDPRLPSLARILAGAGYHVPNLTYLTSINNYYNLGFPPSEEDLFRESEDRILADFLASGPRRPWFAWYHYRFVHLPYSPGEPYESLLAPPGMSRELTEEGRRRVSLVKSEVLLKARASEFGPLEQVVVRSLYDASVRKMDAFVGRVLNELERHGRKDDTVVVLTADHGEELFEHGSIGHASTNFAGNLHDETIRIPLILAAPGRLPRNRRVATPVEQIDVAPTLLDLAGVPVPAGTFQGKSLVPLARGETSRHREATFSETSWAGYQTPQGDTRPPVLSIRKGHWKLIRGQSEPGGLQLFDLDEDPRELVDRAGQGLTQEADLATRLDQWKSSCEQFRKDLLKEPSDPGSTPTTAPSRRSTPGATLLDREALPSDGLERPSPPRIVEPAEGVLEFHRARGTIEVLLESDSEGPFLAEYDVGEGIYATRGQIPLKSKKTRYGPFARDFWKSLLLWNPWKVRVSAGGAEGPWSPWQTFVLELGPPPEVELVGPVRFDEDTHQVRVRLRHVAADDPSAGPRRLYVHLRQGEVLAAVEDTDPVEPGGVIEARVPLSLLEPSPSIPGPLTLAAGAHQGKGTESRAEVRPASPAAARDLKPLSWGQYVDATGARHTWHVDRGHTLHWDGEPWMPMGGMFCFEGLSSFIPDDPDGNERRLRNDLAILDSLRNSGIRDLYVNPVAPLTERPVEVWNRCLKEVDRRGFRYGIEGTDGPVRGLVGLLLGGEHWKAEALSAGRYRLSLKEEFWSLPSLIRVFFIDSSGSVDVVEAPQGWREELKEEGFVTVQGPKGRPGTEMQLVPEIEAPKGFNVGDLWDGYDEYERRLKAHLARLWKGPGLRFFVDPLTNEMNFYRYTASMVPTSERFRAEFAHWLKERYRGDLAQLEAAWRLDKVASFVTASRLVPLAGRRRVLDPVNRAVLPVEEGPSSMIWDLLEFRDHAVAHYCARVSRAVKESLGDIPVVFKNVGRFSRFFINRWTYGGWDGIGIEAFGERDKLISTAAGPSYSLAAHSRRTLWLAVMETCRQPISTGWGPGYDSEEQLRSEMDRLLRLGAKGLFLFALRPLPEQGMEDFLLYRHPEQLNWMKQYRSDRFEGPAGRERTKYVPRVAYTIPARPPGLSLPGWRRRDLLGPNTEKVGQELWCLPAERSDLPAEAFYGRLPEGHLRERLGPLVEEAASRGDVPFIYLGTPDEGVSSWIPRLGPLLPTAAGELPSPPAASVPAESAPGLVLGRTAILPGEQTTPASMPISILREPR